MQHLREMRLLRTPVCNMARATISRVVAQRHAGQTAQHRLHIVHANPESHAHVAEQDALVQCRVARDDAAHEHISAPARILGQGMDADVDTDGILIPTAQQIERLERQTRAPCIVQGGQHPQFATGAHLCQQVGKLQRHRARRLQPHQTGVRADLVRQVIHIHGVVVAMRNPPVIQLTLGQRLARAVGIVGKQHLVARMQQGHVDTGDGSQPARNQHRVAPSLQGTEALFQCVAGGRSMQAIGVAALVQPGTLAHGCHIGKEHGGRLADRRLRRLELGGRLVVVMDEIGAGVTFHAGMITRKFRPARGASCTTAAPTRSG